MGIDGRLVAWARRVKATDPAGPPPLWLFTDPTRLPNPLRAIARLPSPLAGVVLRGGDAKLRLRVLTLCRRRAIPCSVPVRHAAHDAAEVRRAIRAGGKLIFISPVFATASHPGVPALGVRRWLALARACPRRAAALGGIDGRTIHQLPPACRAIGAIAALAPVRQ